MYTNHREAYRQTFYDAWQKYQKQIAMEPVEVLLVEIILIHPEYHALLNNLHACLIQEFTPEENPFMHMSLHVALREQIRSDRPAGITQLHQQHNLHIIDPHQLEHQMMTCLAQVLWEAQQTGIAPDEAAYLMKLKNI